MSENKEIKYVIPSYVQKLFRIFERVEAKQSHSQEGQSMIEIGDNISRLAFFYEKVRNAVDYKEEHLLRKNAILRNLKRRFVGGIDTNIIAEPLIKDLIQSGYLSNKSIPETKIIEVTKIITKYATIINRIYQIHKNTSRTKIFDWLIAICACEIEENLAFAEKERALIDFTYHTLNRRIVIQSSNIKPNIRDLQIYISILRLLVRYDGDMLSYNILRFYFPSWHQLSSEDIEQLAMHIFKIKFKIELQLNHRMAERLNKIVHQYVPIFSIFKDLIEKDPKRLFSLLTDPDELEVAIKKACNEKYKEIKSRLKRTSIRSIIYIFLTKMVIALLLEIPYELYFVKESLNYIPLAINVIFHPVLLFLIALIIRVPSDKNTKKIIEGIKNIIYDYPGKDIKHFIKPPVKRSWIISLIFNFFYFSTFIFTFGVIIFVLYTLHFNVVGMTLFVLFLSLVTFFGLKVRQAARELLVLDRPDGIMVTLINFFFIPIIRAGHWMSVKFSKINVFVFFFDVIVEAPLKLLIDVFEDWSIYIREKKEEIYDRE